MLEMPEEEIAAKVIAIMTEHAISYGCPVAPRSGCTTPKVTRETRLIEDLEFDSLDAVEAILAVEEAFDVYILEDDSDKVRTVGDLVKAVQQAQPADEWRR